VPATYPNPLPARRQQLPQQVPATYLGGTGFWSRLEADASRKSLNAFQPLPARREIMATRLPFQPSATTHWLTRAVIAGCRQKVVGVRGVEHLLGLREPFLVVANHNQRLEAVLLPALLAYWRGGALVHFLADWPMALVPGVAFLYRRNGAILVGGKQPRWPALDVLRPLYVDRRPALDRAFDVLRAGSSVGIFPEGTMNRHPSRLLRGRVGAARLAILAQVPVLPIGLSFPGQSPEIPIADGAKMAIDIGRPLTPTQAGHTAGVADFHVQIMSTLATLAGKSWRPDAPRRKPCAKD
jgi:hypothetical protein